MIKVPFASFLDPSFYSFVFFDQGRKTQIKIKSFTTCLIVIKIESVLNHSTTASKSTFQKLFCYFKRPVNRR